MPGVAAIEAAPPSITQALTTLPAMVGTIPVALARRIVVVATAIPGQATITVNTGIEDLH